jgi:predicted dehydrogenase
MSIHAQTRREFAKTIATAAAMPVLDALRIVQPRKPLGVALVGLGSLSNNQLAPALQKTKFCRLAGIVTGTPAKAARWKARYDIPDRSIYNYDTMESMASNPDIDIVYVVTPNALHAEHTIKAAKAGKHVFCEKPMEVSAAKCEAMIAACKKAGRMLGVAYRCRTEPHHLECERLAREKVLGPVRLIEAAMGFSIGDPRQWRLNRALAGGGPLMDVGIYALQAARMIAGEEPVLVSATESAKTDPVKFKEVEESIAWTLRFPTGALAHCSTTYRANGMDRFSAFAERGSFGMGPAFNYGPLRGWRSDEQKLSFAQVDHFAVELDEFAQCILDKRPTRMPGEEGLRDVRILMAIYESARTGKSIKLA